jgi:hypothetical protein
MLVHNLPFYFVIFVSRKMLFVEITICRATSYRERKTGKGAAGNNHGTAIKNLACFCVR